VTSFGEAAGWMPGVEYVPMVPERYAYPDTVGGTTPGNMYPQAVVEHVMGGHFSYALEMMRDATVGDDADDYASWHFSVARDGRVAQHAPIWTPCMGAGLRSNQVTAEPISTFRQRWHTNPNAWTVHVEHEDAAVRNPTITDAQLEASIRIHRWIFSMCKWLSDLPRGFWWLPDTADSRFLYHSQISPVDRADDPGTNFPWDRLVEGSLGAAPAAPPAEPQPPADLNREMALAVARAEGYSAGWRAHHARVMDALLGLAEPQ
jgi:N-acetyl-anhydromuramyl-L-alanine amidase AmpD